jgi:mannose/fructose-specific phosphotransferase system component IIA
LVARIETWLAESEAADGVILFIDDYGGSCASAAQLACAQHPRAVILGGVNLTMLLGFATWRESLDICELAEKLVQKGREAIVRIGASPKHGAA